MILGPWTARLILGWSGALVPASSLAEVMDKEPTVAALWAWSSTFVALAVLLSRWTAWLPLVIWPFSITTGLVILGEILDPAVGPAILREAGWPYLIQAVGLAVVNIVAPIVITVWVSVKRHRALVNAQE